MIGLRRPYFARALCLLATAAFFRVAKALFLVCFWFDFFWVDFGERSPISFIFLFQVQLPAEYKFSAARCHHALNRIESKQKGASIDKILRPTPTSGPWRRASSGGRHEFLEPLGDAEQGQEDGGAQPMLRLRRDRQPVHQHNARQQIADDPPDVGFATEKR